jgi:hypothetical protein
MKKYLCCTIVSLAFGCIASAQLVPNDSIQNFLKKLGKEQRFSRKNIVISPKVGVEFPTTKRSMPNPLLGDAYVGNRKNLLLKGNNGKGFNIYTSPVDKMIILVPDSSQHAK